MLAFVNVNKWISSLRYFFNLQLHLIKTSILNHHCKSYYILTFCQVNRIILKRCEFCWLLDPDYDPKQAKKFEKELKKMEGEEKKHTLRGTAKAVALTQRLSPKAQRKKDKIDPNIAKLKVWNIENAIYE